MPAADPDAFSLDVDPATRVSALLTRPADARAACVLAHGAGAGMTHPFMQALADGLAQRRIATLRYQFPFMQRGSTRTDPPALAQAAVRAAVIAAAQRLDGLALFAGGKSFGARMTSQAQAVAPLPAVRGLVFVGFPLHPADRPSDERARHLSEVRVPMLFLQGTRDKLAQSPLVQALVDRLGAPARLEWLEHADHGFEVLVRSGTTAERILAELLDRTAAWMLEYA